MISKPDALRTLPVFFEEHSVATLPDLRTVLGSVTRMTVFRRLRELNYLSSFSHVGRYYTLPGIVHFDQQGLWFYQEVGFSRFGTLKKTVVQLVEQSIAGKIHEELEQQLRLRVHNTLLDLVRSGKLTRAVFEGCFVYLSIQTDQARQQLECRREGVNDRTQEVLADGMVIEVLAEIIRSNRVDIDHETLITRLSVRGIRITPRQLQQLCIKLDLKKTPEFTS